MPVIGFIIILAVFLASVTAIAADTYNCSRRHQLRKMDRSMRGRKRF